MTWYLQHYFDPHVNQRRLTPTPGAKKNLHNLGFVQNVHEGQLLAEIIPFAAAKEREPRYVLSHPVFPAGENTHADPDNALRLLASKNGYVAYINDKICVSPVLKVHSDVCFQTGNIVFNGDTAINGNVRAGFEVHGKNVLISGMVEGGIVRAQKALHIMGGIRGGAGRHCLLAAQKDMRMAFLEKTEALCHGNIIIEKNCMHSTLYAARNTLIKGRLVGGTIHGLQGVFVAENVGNSAAVPTRIFLGYDPMHIRKLEKIDAHLNTLAHEMQHLTAVAGHLAPQVNELSRKLYQAQQKNAKLLQARNHIWEHLQWNEEHIGHCKLVVMGTVHAGVEIAIGQAYIRIDKPCNSVVFSLQNNDIICSPYSPSQKHE